MSFEQYRADFPMLNKTMHGKPLVYLDSAATSLKPYAVINSICDFYQEHYGTVHRAVYELAVKSTDLYHSVRLKIQNFINANSSDEIIFTKGTTEAVNLVASSFSKAFLSEGDEVLVSQIEHHSNIVPWQIACEVVGAHLKVIPVDDDGNLDLEEFQNLLSSRTRLVAVGHVSNALGTIHPLKKIISMSRAFGAKVFIDGAQGVPHSVVDVQDLDCDFYVFSGHKALGPTGVGVLYGKKDLLEVLPPYQGGGDMIDRVSFDKTTYAGLPNKFEAGTPGISGVLGLGAAIDYLVDVGLDNVHDWEQRLTGFALEEMKNISGLKLIGQPKHRAGIISFVVDGVHHLDLGTFLDLQGVAVRTGHHCAQPCMERFGITGSVRASFYLYNNEEDVERFIASLKKVIDLLRA